VVAPGPDEAARDLAEGALAGDVGVVVADEYLRGDRADAVVLGVVGDRDEQMVGDRGDAVTVDDRADSIEIGEDVGVERKDHVVHDTDGD